MLCPVCKNKASYNFSKNGFDILECDHCRHRFVDLELTPEQSSRIYSDSYFFDGGAGYLDYTLEGNILVKRGEYYSKKIRRYINGGSVLDVGAAAGYILKGFINEGWDGVGIEPNESMVDIGTKVNGVELIKGSIETSGINRQFELLTLIQVIAHLYDLDTALENCSKYLKPGGYVLIETWNGKSLVAKIFGKHWHEYSPPSTLNFFSPATLDKLMGRFGFEAVKSGSPRKKILSDHAKSLLRSKLSETFLFRYLKGLVNIIPDGISIPYPGFDLFWKLYRKF